LDPHRRPRMFQVTEQASAAIKEHFKDRETVPTLRVYLSQGGWSGPSLGMALDEPKEDDQVFQESGIKFTVNTGLYEQVKPIQIDFVKTDRGSGYRVTGNITKSCGSCSCSWFAEGRTIQVVLPFFLSFPANPPFSPLRWPNILNHELVDQISHQT